MVDAGVAPLCLWGQRLFDGHWRHPLEHVRGCPRLVIGTCGEGGKDRREGGREGGGREGGREGGSTQKVDTPAIYIRVVLRMYSAISLTLTLRGIK